MREFYNPVRVSIEPETLEPLQKRLAQRKIRTYQVITYDASVFDNQDIQNLIDHLPGQEIEPLYFKGSNPTVDDVWTLLQTIEQLPDLLIGIGGGSVLDLTKAISQIYPLGIESKEALERALASNSFDNNKGCMLMLLPSTAGTGSEVTPWATIWNPAKGEKYSVHHEALFAEEAMIFTSLMDRLPLGSTVSTAFDALCHATEAYWSKRSNLQSRLYAKEAIRLGMDGLQKGELALLQQETRLQLAKASVLAGLAFSNTKTTACHSMSYPLTMAFNIPHGIAVALTLGQVYEHNKDVITEGDALRDAFGLREGDTLEEKMRALFTKYQIPSRLRDYGVKTDDIEELVNRSFTKGRMDNNPVPLQQSTVQDILNRIY